jgi:hypothetical protein
MKFIFKTLDPFVFGVGRYELCALLHTHILTYCLIYVLPLLLWATASRGNNEIEIFLSYL